jgi:hypothetical protein
MDREWTDKRADDLAERVGRFEGDVKERFDKVDQRFDKADQRFDSLEVETKAGFAYAAAESKADLAKLDTKMDKIIWTLIGLSVSILATGLGKILLG